MVQCRQTAMSEPVPVPPSSEGGRGVEHRCSVHSLRHQQSCWGACCRMRPSWVGVTTLFIMYSGKTSLRVVSLPLDQVGDLKGRTHETVSAKALEKMGLKEAMKLGLSGWHRMGVGVGVGAEESHFPRVTWTGQASVWVVMGASSEKASFGPAAVTDIYLPAGCSSGDLEDTCTVYPSSPWGPLSLLRFLLCGFGLCEMLALCPWGSVYLICRMDKQKGLPCNLRHWCVNH